MKKRIVTISLVIALLATCFAGTYAYLMDTDAAKNTMTMGSVDIEQIEQQLNAQNQLVGFDQDKPLLPAVFEGSSIPYDDASEWVVANNEAWKIVDKDNANVVDKFVTVQNTGKSAAYVRTLIAYEGNATYGPEGAYIHIVHNGNNNNLEKKIDIELIGVVTIDSVEYTVYSYTYESALAPNEYSIPSLKQVYMNKAATNEVVEQYGAKYDILVLSQAVQADGFADAATALDTAFGDVTAATAAEWLANVQ